jgi:hypothetical protein
VYLSGKFVSGAAKSFTAGLGVCAVVWALSSISIYRHEPRIANAARGILNGEAFNSDQLVSLRRLVDSASSVRSLTATDVAAIRLRILENELSANPARPDDVNLARSAVFDALEGAPTSSFLWLAAYWLQQGTDPDHGARSLRMSYRQGPNEAWVATKRNPLVLRAIASLPDDLAESAVTEFAGLVRSGLYEYASRIVVDCKPAVQQRLLSRLIMVSEEDRRNFARVLESKGLDHLSVPGVAKRPPPTYWR